MTLRALSSPTPKPWVLAVHIGAGHHAVDKDAQYTALMQNALNDGRALLLQSRERPSRAAASSVAAQVVARVLAHFERSDATNAGRGSNLTEAQRVECEATVVCGKSQLVAACAGVEGVAEPSALALQLLDQAIRSDQGELDDDAHRPGPGPGPGHGHGRQVPLVVAGAHCRRLAQQFGLETAANDAEARTFQVTDAARAQWATWHARLGGGSQHGDRDARGENERDDHRLDTVGAVCLDPDGNVAAALSSGGVLYKVPGRVGLAGCPRVGCNAVNPRRRSDGDHGRTKRKRTKQCMNAFAVAGTGRGEHFIRSQLIAKASEQLATTTDLDGALKAAFDAANAENGPLDVEGGVLAFIATPVARPTRRQRCSPETQPPQVTGDHKSIRVQLGAAFTTPSMGVGFVHSEEANPQVQMLRHPGHSRRSRQSTAQTTLTGLSVHVSLVTL